jgi:glycosyltransferase involved in cell wall biosynthesis
MICATYPPDICGVGDNAAHLSLTLRDMGWQVSVLTSNSEKASHALLQNNGVLVRRAYSNWNFRTIIKILSDIRRERYDVVHIQYTPQMFGSFSFGIAILPSLVRLLAGRPVFITFHEIYTPFINDLRQNILILLNRVKDTIILLGCSEAFVSVPKRAEHLGHLYPWKRNRLHVIPIGPNIIPERAVPNTAKNLRPQRADLKHGLGVPEDAILLGSFGMLHIDKRYDLLLKCLRGLIDRGHHIRLLLIGPYSEEHPYFIYVKKCIDDLDLAAYIVWTGSGTPHEVSGWFSLLDIYVMTDIRGASDRKSSMLSALSHGLPVVSNRGSDTTESFVNNENIVLLPENAEDEFVAAIEKLILAPQLRHDIGVQARSLYQRSYAWDVIANRSIEQYGHYVPRV